jgi:hypothetical protein
MRKAILVALCALTTAAAAVAQEPTTDKPTTDRATADVQEPTQDKPAAPSKYGKEITALVVAADPVGKTITVKKEPPMGQSGSQPETIFPVDEKAIANLKTVKAGEKVKLVLKMDPASGKESVQSVEKPTAPPSQQ